MDGLIIILRELLQHIMIPIGWIIGRMNERKHLSNLEERELACADIIETNLRTPPAEWVVESAVLVHGQAVIGSDAFKTFAARWRNVFGGEVRSFDRMLSRARREARLRMIEESRALGANVVWNVRYETSNIGSAQGNIGRPMAEIHAYATAMRIPQL